MRRRADASPRRRTVLHWGTAGILGLVALVLATGCSSDNTTKGANAMATSTVAPGGANGAGDGGAGAGAPGAADMSAALAGPPEAPGGTGTAVGTGKAMPVDVSVSGTAGLHDGDPVTINATPKEGSQLFGFEAFLCTAAAQFVNDADVRPLQMGKCVTQPLSPVSDKYVLVKAEPPFKAASGQFRVGVGTNSYTTRAGDPVTIVCGPTHPCKLVLKLQYPDGFGFAAYPLTFA